MFPMKRWQFIAGVSVALFVLAWTLRMFNIISQAVYFWPGFLSIVIMIAVIAYFLPFPEDRSKK
jgi:asparagine N-glycosylation enzyme membrane subunit Stt3